MAVNVATLEAELRADTRQFNSKLDAASGKLGNLETAGKRANTGLSTLKKSFIALGGVIAAVKIAQFATNAIQLAVAAEEAASAFETTFGPAVDDVNEFVEEFANKAGFAEFELQQLLATTGNVIQGLGGTEEKSAELAETMAILAGDVASFSNAAGGAPAVLKALQSALTGEREALKTYGIVVTEADVQQRALADSGKTAASELTKLEKATATVAIASERAGKAVGDLDRTSDSAANTQRRVAAEFKEVSAAIGAQLLPALEALLPVAEKTALILLDLVPGANTKADINTFVGALNEGTEAARALAVETLLLDEGSAKGAAALKRLGVDMLEVLKVANQGEEAIGEWVFALIDSTDAAGKSTDGLLGLTSQLGELADEYLAAILVQAEEERALKIQDQKLRQTAEAQSRLTRRIEEATRADRVLTGGLSNLAEANDEVSNAIDEVIESESELLNLRRAAIDPAFAFVHAQRDLADALNTLNELEAEGKTATREYENAVIDAFEASLDLDDATNDLADQGLPNVTSALLETAEKAGVADRDLGFLWNTLSGFAGDAQNLGFSIKGGILVGLDGLASEMTASLGAKIQTALSNTQAKFGMLSPSTVFATEVGEPIGQGIAQGINDSADLVISAVQQLMADAQSHATSLLADITGGISEGLRLESALLRQEQVRFTLAKKKRAGETLTQQDLLSLKQANLAVLNAQIAQGGEASLIPQIGLSQADQEAFLASLQGLVTLSPQFQATLDAALANFISSFVNDLGPLGLVPTSPHVPSVVSNVVPIQTLTEPVDVPRTGDTITIMVSGADDPATVARAVRRELVKTQKRNATSGVI